MPSIGFVMEIRLWRVDSKEKEISHSRLVFVHHKILPSLEVLSRQVALSPAPRLQITGRHGNASLSNASSFCPD